MSKQPLFFKAAYYLPSPRLSTSPFTSLNRLMNGFLCRDRFNILNKHSEFRMDTEADPVPTPFTEPVSISDLIDARAVELLSRNQQIVVQYSGGVDSTVALIALMKHLPENEWNRITLFYDEGGIEENPEFWSMLNLTKIRKTLLLPSEFVEAMREDDYDLIVSGRCADALFGPNIHVMVPNAYHLPWLDGIREAFKVIPRTKISDTSLEVDRKSTRLNSSH